MKAVMASSKAAFVLLLLLWHPLAQAHAFIEHSQPKTGEELAVAPKEIILTYTKNIEPVFCSIQLSREASQEPVKTEKAHGIDDEPNKLVLALPKLSPGEYHVYWVVVSRDGHRTMGDYTFVVH